VTTATLPIDINTTINTFPTETLPVTTAFATTLTEIKEETATSTPRKVRPIFTINPDDDNSNADVSINVSSPEDYPETTSHDNDVAIATITTPHEDEVATVTTINGENNVSVGEIYTTTYPTNNDSVNVDNSVSEAKIYLVLKVVLYPNEDGFYYDGTTYPDRIINSFSFGEYITGIIPLDTYNETYHGYEHLFIIDLKNLYQDETLSTSNILSEIRQCEYMYYQPIDTRFTTMDTTNLDFNNNGIDASSDEEDRNTLLSIIYR
jgi:hypothetical protein